jgi:hypothetical protein
MPAGKSIIDMLWDEMDAQYERLMADGPPEYSVESDTADVASDYQAYGEQRGRCQATAYALAIMTNPYRPDVPGIKAEAKRRWQGKGPK